MTFRAKPVGRTGRPTRDHQSRRSLYTNLGFGLAIVAAILILLVGTGLAYYNDHFGPIATVNGTAISRDDYRTRLEIELWRFDQAEQLVRDEFSAGRISQAERDAGISSIDQQRQAATALTQQRLIDAELQRQIAPAQGVEVTPAEVDARMLDEATREEQRHGWLIEVEPEIAADADEPTEAQVAAAKETAEKALADLRAGKDWEEVAKATSTAGSAAQGGDIGWVNAQANLDEVFRTALFAVAVDTPTDVVEGEDGTFRIGRVTDILEASVDPAYEQKLIDKGIVIADYRKVVEADVRRQELDDRITASVATTPTTQRRVSEIYLAVSQGAGDEVKVSHILYAPNDIANQADLDALEDDDPAWEAARVEAQSAYDKLKPFVGTSELETEFSTLAREESDEPGADTSGGDLPYFTRDQVDRQFGDAIFDPELAKGDLLEPVRSQFGWHVILYEDRRVDPKSRIDATKIQADAPDADFAALAREVSEGAEAASGGELGWIAKYQLDDVKEKAVFDAPVGGTSDVLEVEQDGYYLYKVWEEQSRIPDGEQLESLEASAFDNWYTAEKGKADIDTDFGLPTSI
jgi:parvulin-like peptidyl-prolyl isomerase